MVSSFASSAVSSVLFEASRGAATSDASASTLSDISVSDCEDSALISKVSGST